MLESVKIIKSVENLVGTAVIVLPGSYMNSALHLDKIKEGDRIEIQLGYGEEGLRTEFTGYLSNIATDDNSIKLECEDGLYLFKKRLKDEVLIEKEHTMPDGKKIIEYVTLKDVLEKVIKEINALNNTDYSLKCDYEYIWKTFIFLKDTGFDVLKRIQKEFSANIYLKDKELHIHPPYSEIDNKQPVIFDFAVNVEKYALKYVKEEDKKIEVEVTATKDNGEVSKKYYGTKGGTVIKKTVNSADKEVMQNAAKSEYETLVYEGYEGSITGWLIPYVEPAYKIQLHDSSYTDKNTDINKSEACYYVTGTEVDFSSAGGVRTIKLGRKI